jgi:hypothetical protein
MLNILLATVCNRRGVKGAVVGTRYCRRLLIGGLTRDTTTVSIPGGWLFQDIAYS